jgi:hypothetical protein
MTDKTTAVRTGVLTALQASGGPGAPVYDRVPDNQPPPAVIIDTVENEGGMTKAGGPYAYTVEIVTVLRTRSKVAIEAVMAGVFNRLENVSLSGIVATRPRLESATLDSSGNDGLTMVGRQFFRLMVLED